MDISLRAQLLVILLVLTACSSLPPQTETSLATASEAYFAASRSADFAKAATLLADDHLFIGPTGKIQDKATRVAWLKDNRDWLPSVTTQDVHVTQFGQTGRVTGVWVIPDAGAIIRERFVQIWILQHGRWQMISHQVTVIPSKGRDNS